MFWSYFLGQTKIVIPLSILAGFFGLLEFALIWKVDFGMPGYWTYFYIPMYIITIVLMSLWLWLLASGHWDLKSYYGDYEMLMEGKRVNFVDESRWDHW